MKMDMLYYLKKYAVIIILSLLTLLYAGYLYYNNQLLKSRTESLDIQLRVFKEEQQKSIDSLKIINSTLREKLVNEKNKPPIIIPRYNEKIIYTSVNDSAIIGKFSRERQDYLQKRSR